MLFGNFADMIVGEFGPGLDVLVDPYTSADKGDVRIVVYWYVDLVVRHAQSFAVCKDLVTS